jgi:hypothetical protein
MPPASPYVVSWQALLICAWLGTVLVVAILVLAIVKAVINKTDARDVPRVLDALGPLLGGVVKPLVRGPFPLTAVPPINPIQTPPPINPIQTPPPDSTVQSGGAQISPTEAQP